MTKTYYINLDAQASDSLKFSKERPLQSVNSPDFFVGDILDFQVKFLNNLGEYVDVTSNSVVKMGLGSTRKGPNSGTYEIFYADKSASLSYDAKAADIQSAINAWGLGEVGVFGRDGSFSIKFSDTGSVSSSFSADLNGLQPECYATILQQSTGSFDFYLKPKLYAYFEANSNIVSSSVIGVSGSFNLKTKEAVQAVGQQSVPALWQIELDDKIVLSKEVVLKNELINDYVADYEPVTLPQIVTSAELNQLSSSFENRVLNSIYLVDSSSWNSKIANITASYSNTANYIPVRGQESEILVSAIDLSTTNLNVTSSHKTGRITWNQDDYTAEVHTDVNEVRLQLGQESVVRVRNASGATILNGKAVYISSAQGNMPLISLADGNNSTSVDRTIGLTTHDIENNSVGYVTVFGMVRDINTNGYPEGSKLYLGSSGSFTLSSSSLYQVQLGYVVREHINFGSILVNVDKRGSQLGASISNTTSTSSLLSLIGAVSETKYSQDSSSFNSNIGNRLLTSVYTTDSASVSSRITRTEGTGSVLVAASASLSTRTTNLETGKVNFSDVYVTGSGAPNIFSVKQVAGSVASNTRGTGSVDLQQERDVSSKVASGTYATIAGGRRNTASNTFAAVTGGQNNLANGGFAFVGGGQNNTAGNGDGTVVAGGQGNTASNGYSAVLGGLQNASTGYRSAIVGGGNNFASSNDAFIGAGEQNSVSGASRSSIVGGQQNTVSAAYSSVLGGQTNAVAAINSTITGGQNNRILSSANHSGILSGQNNQNSGSLAVIAGGIGNRIRQLGTGAFIGGGSGSVASDRYVTIAGGFQNSGSTEFSFVGGGYKNTAFGKGSVIGGGYNNTTSGYLGSVVAGGKANTSSNYCSAVGGGQSNIASGGQSTVAGGQSNEAIGQYSTIAGGNNNTASGYASVVGGGANNSATDLYGTVAGGSSNTASTYFSTVGGGAGNNSSGQYSTIAGGYNNTASGQNSVVCGGRQGYASGPRSFVGNGGGNEYNSSQGNTASGYGSVVVGGGNYQLRNVASGDQSFIGGGVANEASGYASIIVGGSSNFANSTMATIVGGNGNVATGEYSSILGGTSNTAYGFYATVGGGQYNSASGSMTGVFGGGGNIARGAYSFIGAGLSNTANAPHSIILGGSNNVSSGTGSVILGGGNNVISTSGSYGIASGVSANVTRYGMTAHSVGPFSFTGDTQRVTFLLRNSTNNATPTSLFLDGISQRLTMPSGRVLSFIANITGVSSNGTNVSMYVRQGVIKNVSGTVSLVGTVNTVGVDIESDPATNVSITADNTNKSLEITVTGVAATTYRWTADVFGIEMWTP